jgi:saccharopine dehydrogenase-like NADP-dependent oxidoreductase
VLKKDDKDLLVMQHRFIYELAGKEKCITSTLVVIGKDQDNTAMAVTVGIPMAIGAKMLMTGQIKLRGVQMPIVPELYQPILSELEQYGVTFKEEEVY